MHLSLKGSLKSSLIFTYVKTDQALDLGNLEPFTIPDLSGNANTATLYSGIYVTTNGSTDKAIGANATALGSGNYYLTGKIKPAGTTAKTTMDGSTASNLTGLTAGVWQDFQTATASAITPSSINLGWDGTAFNATVDNWSDVKLHDASDDSVVAHWKLYDSADASLDGYPALDCVGGYHGAHVGCAGGASEASILQTAGEDFNKRMWFNKSNTNVELADDPDFDFSTALSVSVKAKNSKTTTSGSNEYIVAKYDSGTTEREWALAIDTNDKLIANFGDATGNFQGSFRSNGVVDIDDLKTYGFTYSAGTVVLYVDGVVIPSSSVTGGAPATLNNETAPISIGSALSSGTPTVVWDGIIFDCSIHAATLTPAQMLALHNGEEVATGRVYFGKGNGNTDAGWTDQSGNGNDGTVNGSPSLYHVAESETTAGQDALGNAIENPRPNERVLNLTTGTGYAEIADSASLDLTTEATWEVWPDFQSTGSQRYILSKYDTGGNNRSWGIVVENPNAGSNTLNVAFGDPADGTFEARLDWAITEEVACYHIIYDGSLTGTARCKLYKNGDLVALSGSTGNPPASLYQTNTPVLVCAVLVSGVVFGIFDEQLGDIRIYNRALTADEITKNYNARKSAYGL